MTGPVRKKQKKSEEKSSSDRSLNESAPVTKPTRTLRHTTKPIANKDTNNDTNNNAKSRKRKEPSKSSKVASKKEEIPKVDQEALQCGICLDTVKLQGVLNSCSHSFCMVCIKEWSKTSNTCPFCKVRFTQLTQVDLLAPKKKAKKVKVKHAEQKVEHSFNPNEWLDTDSEDDEDYDEEMMIYPNFFLSLAFNPFSSLFVSSDDEFYDGMNDGFSDDDGFDYSTDEDGVIDLTREDEDEEDEVTIQPSLPPSHSVAFRSLGDTLRAQNPTPPQRRNITSNRTNHS